MTTLFGHGYVGNAIAKYFNETGEGFYWSHHDDKNVLQSDVVVNAAGYVGIQNVDACELHKEECIEGNVIWPMKLEQKYKYTPIIHVSSGCVYNGYKKGGFTEKDAPNFTGW